MDDFRTIGARLSNWGRWGDDDERGTVNLITPECIVAATRLVRRGEPVSVVVRSGSLSIATPGKALGGGAAGDLVRVVVAATNRTLDGIVHAPGEVRVTAR